MILTKPYNRERAVTYAETWALGRNPLFLNFAGRGGDCTNFTSQCLLAGSCTMDFTPDFGWYYRTPDDRAPAWTSVAFFYDFITEQPLFAAENAGGFAFFQRGFQRNIIFQIVHRQLDFIICGCVVAHNTAGNCQHRSDQFFHRIIPFLVVKNIFIIAQQKFFFKFPADFFPVRAAGMPPGQCRKTV